jgi:hypothetical protein
MRSVISPIRNFKCCDLFIKPSYLFLKNKEYEKIASIRIEYIPYFIKA